MKIKLHVILTVAVLFLVIILTKIGNIQTSQVFATDFQVELSEDLNDKAETFTPDEMITPQIVQDEANEVGEHKNRVRDLPIEEFTDFAEIQILNKVTAENIDVVMAIGEEREFYNTLRIKVFKCWKAPPEQKPENKLLLEIHDITGFTKKLLFRGWTLTSNSGVSSLEHPLYDVTLVECRVDNTVSESDW